jgi:hypothetical protein
MTNGVASPASGRKESAWKIYAAAAFGAFILGFSDLLKNGSAATVLKMAEVLRQYVYSGFGTGAWFALLALAILGIALCWIHGPGNHIDAFSRGFSVFAVLAVTVPTDDPPAKVTSTGAGHSAYAIDFLISPANAQMAGAPPGTYVSSAKNEGTVVIQLPHLKDLENPPPSVVTLRDAKSEKVVTTERISGSKFKISRPVGNYLMEVETPSYRRVSVKLEIKHPVDAYALSVKEAAVPLNVQRIYGPAAGELIPLPAETYKQLGIQSFQAGNYGKAVTYYDKALAIEPNDIEIYNYKGYSLFRDGKPAQALPVLQKATAINPRDFSVRLNLANVYCKLGNTADARMTLLGQPALSKGDLKTASRDGEFQKVCSAIAKDVKQ